MTFDPKKWLNVDPVDARKFIEEDKGNGKRSPSSRLLPPVRLNDPNALGNPVEKPEPVAAQLVVRRMMSDEFKLACVNAGLRAKTTNEFIGAIRTYLITGRVPQ